jgi:hypothetical protein
MKTLLLTILFTLCAAPCFAASCGDTQDAANAAMKERNALVKGSYNVMMPDPEDTRGPFSDCLGTINDIGAVFSLGVSLPSMDQIIAGMCKQVDSMIQDKMNDVLSEIKSTVSDIGQNNPFQVSGSGVDLSKVITVKIK